MTASLTVVAENPLQLQQASEELMLYLKMKIEAEEKLCQDLADNIAIAKREGWCKDAFVRALSKSRSCCLYYNKIIHALKAGYFIIPNFPGWVNIFAIRTKKQYPSHQSFYGSDVPCHQKAQRLPVGEGRYVDKAPSRIVTEHERKKGDEIETYYKTRADKFQEPGLPTAKVKPQVLEATSKALQEKIFDEIGLIRHNADPVIVGHILKDQYKYTSFIIAWWLDADTL